jgi:cytoskeletal protein CcmA (bactofilin family)
MPIARPRNGGPGSPTTRSRSLFARPGCRPAPKLAAFSPALVTNRNVSLTNPCNHPTMADEPKRRIADRFNGTPTVIGEGVSMQGDLVSPGSVVLCGSIIGDGDVAGALSIARSARWEGQVRALSAVVAGHLIGSLAVTERLEVGSAAIIKGRITAKTLAIARGAVIEGDILVTSGEPIIQFEEKREQSR